MVLVMGAWGGTRARLERMKDPRVRKFEARLGEKLGGPVSVESIPQCAFLLDVMTVLAVLKRRDIGGEHGRRA